MRFLPSDQLILKMYVSCYLAMQGPADLSRSSYRHKGYKTEEFIFLFERANLSNH